MEREFLKNKFEELEELRAAGKFDEGLVLIKELDTYLDDMDEELKDEYIPLANWVTSMKYCESVIGMFFCEWESRIPKNGDYKKTKNFVYCNNYEDHIVDQLTNEDTDYNFLKTLLSSLTIMICESDDTTTLQRFEAVYHITIVFAEQNGYGKEFAVFKSKELGFLNETLYRSANINYKLLNHLFKAKHK